MFDSVWMRLRCSWRILLLASTRMEPKGSSPALRASWARWMHRWRKALSVLERGILVEFELFLGKE